jgi:hypothetical protein
MSMNSTRYRALSALLSCGLWSCVAFGYEPRGVVEQTEEMDEELDASAGGDDKSDANDAAAGSFDGFQTKEDPSRDAGAPDGLAESGICEPCDPPPKSDCVGTGPCGCAPYTCPDSGVAEDSASCDPDASSERLLPIACAASDSVLGCERTLDGILRPEWLISCDEHPAACDFAGDGCDVEGCIEDFTLMYRLTDAAAVDRIRYRSDWHNKRPRNWQLWVSDEETLTPGAGATLVTSGTGNEGPWRCVAGESCLSDHVPDECCPDGRDQPQAPESEQVALWDEQDFAGVVGRIWWFRIQDTQDRINLTLAEVELHGRDCVGASE